MRVLKIRQPDEEANTLARKGAQTPFIGPQTFYGVGKCSYKKEFRKKEETEKEAL